MHLEISLTLISALLLRGPVEASVTSEDLRLRQWQFDGGDWKVLVEEPSFGRESYTIARCNLVEVANAYIVHCTIESLEYDDGGGSYNRQCSIQASVQQNDGFPNDFRLRSMGNGNKVASLSTYRDDESNVYEKVEISGVNMTGCSMWRSNKVMNVRNSQHDVIAYDGNTFDYVIKTGRSFENRTYFKLSMNDAGASLGNAVIAYEYEAPRNYNAFDVYPMDRANPARGYFFVYDFGDVVKVFGVNSNGEIKVGRNIFRRYSEQETYGDVSSAQSSGAILVCGHVTLREKKVNLTCTLLGESLSVRFNGSYVSAASEKIVASCVLKSNDVLLASVDSKADNATFLFDKISTKLGLKERVFELKETTCEAEQAVKFGKVYELTNDVCFSTYCSDGNSKLRKWNVRCFDKMLLQQRESQTVRVVYVTSNILIFSIVGFQIVLYVMLYVAPGLSALMWPKNAESRLVAAEMQQTKWPLK